MISKKNNPDGFSILLDFSHEIRNPLNGINGMVDILSGTSLDPDQRSIVRNIEEKSEQLNNILNLILEYSKITNGMIKNTPEQIFIYPYLQKELDKIFKYFVSKRVKFCYYIPPQLNGIAVADPYILSQIIQLSSKNFPTHLNHSKLDLDISFDENIISFNYKISGGQNSNINVRDNQESHVISLLLEKYVHLIGGQISDNIFETEKKLCIEVPVKCSPVDISLPAIDKNQLLKNKNLIFFNFQSDSCESTSKYLEYLGMKLHKEDRSINQIEEDSIVQNYNIIGIDISHISKHEFQVMDEIRLISQLPIVMFKESDKLNEKILTLQKDVVVMYKPVSPANLSFVLKSVLTSQADQLREWAKNPISVLADYHNNLKILIADDESINQRVLREYIGKLHLKADFVNDGKKAVDLYIQNKYDLILMDIQMPVMNGADAAREIRNIKNNHHPYIVAITADALKGGKQKYLEAGMNDYLLKPVNLDEITRIIRKYIEHFKH